MRLPLPRLPVLLLRRRILRPNMPSTHRLPRSLSPLRPCRWQRQRLDLQQRPLSVLLLRSNMHSSLQRPPRACIFYGRAAGGGGSVRSSGGCRSCFSSPTVTPNYNASHAVCPFCVRAAGSGGSSLRSNGGRAYSAFAHVAEPRRLGCRSCGCRVVKGTHLRPRQSTSDPRYGRVREVLYFASIRSQRRYRWSWGWGSTRISRRRHDGKLRESYKQW